MRGDLTADGLNGLAPKTRELAETTTGVVGQGPEPGDDLRVLGGDVVLLAGVVFLTRMIG